MAVRLYVLEKNTNDKEPMIKIDKIPGIEDQAYIKDFEESLNNCLAHAPLKLKVETKNKTLTLRKDDVKKSIPLGINILPNWITSFVDIEFEDHFPHFTVTKEESEFYTLEKYFNIEKYEDIKVDYLSAVKEHGVEKALAMVNNKESVYTEHKLVIDRVYLRADKLRVKLYSRKKSGERDIRYYYVTTVYHEPAIQFLTYMKESGNNIDKVEKFLSSSDKAGITNPSIPVVDSNIKDYLELFATSLFDKVFYKEGTNDLPFDEVVIVKGNSFSLYDRDFQTDSEYELQESLRFLKAKYRNYV